MSFQDFMSGDSRDKPNLVFRLSPVKPYHDDRLERLVEAQLEITGAIFKSKGYASMQELYTYDYVALGGRPVWKRNKRLNVKKLNKRSAIQIQITNYGISSKIPWQLIFTLSCRPGTGRREKKRKVPYVQIFKTYEAITRKKTDEYGNVYVEKHKKKSFPLTTRTNKYKHYYIDKNGNEQSVDKNSSLMKEASKRKKYKKLRRFYTKIEDTIDDPIRIFLPKQQFRYEPADANSTEEEREKITYTIRLAGKRRYKDPILFFHHANMFIVKEETLAELERRIVELETQDMEALGLSTRVSQLQLQRIPASELEDIKDQLSSIYELLAENERRPFLEAEQRIVSEEERRRRREE